MLCSFDKKVEHYRVILNNNRVTVDEEEYFENLVKLVEVSITIACNLTIYCCYCVYSIIRKKLTACVQDCVLLLTRRESMMFVLIWMHLKKVSIPEGGHCLLVYSEVCTTAGWAIQRKEIQLGQLLGKGEFGGELLVGVGFAANDRWYENIRGISGRVQETEGCH